MAGYRPQFTASEDTKILRYIIDNQKWYSVRGNLLWKTMEKLDKFKPRTWQSLKNRFLKTIITQLNSPQYKLTNEELTGMRMALDKTRRAGRTRTSSPENEVIKMSDSEPEEVAAEASSEQKVLHSKSRSAVRINRLETDEVALPSTTNNESEQIEVSAVVETTSNNESKITESSRGRLPSWLIRSVLGNPSETPSVPKQTQTTSENVPKVMVDKACQFPEPMLSEATQMESSDYFSVEMSEPADSKVEPSMVFWLNRKKNSKNKLNPIKKEPEENTGYPMMYEVCDLTEDSSESSRETEENPIRKELVVVLTNIKVEPCATSPNETEQPRIANVDVKIEKESCKLDDAVSDSDESEVDLPRSRNNSKPCPKRHKKEYSESKRKKRKVKCEIVENKLEEDDNAPTSSKDKEIENSQNGEVVFIDTFMLKDIPPLQKIKVEK